MICSTARCTDSRASSRSPAAMARSTRPSIAAPGSAGGGRSELIAVSRSRQIEAQIGFGHGGFLAEHREQLVDVRRIEAFDHLVAQQREVAAHEPKLLLQVAVVARPALARPPDVVAFKKEQATAAQHRPAALDLLWKTQAAVAIDRLVVRQREHAIVSFGGREPPQVGGV